jgi:hypothetical protein
MNLPEKSLFFGQIVTSVSTANVALPHPHQLCTISTVAILSGGLIKYNSDRFTLRPSSTNHPTTLDPPGIALGCADFTQGWA